MAFEPRLITFGCRLNASETEAMRAHAAAAGLADTILVNTCAVTNEAVAQARQAIRRARRNAPSARIVVTGCAAQIEPATFAAMPEVDHVVGNGEKLAPETYTRLAAGAPRLLVGDVAARRGGIAHRPATLGASARACLQIQNGCDHRCTFCVIPFGRGASRSVPPGEVVAQAHQIVEAGVPEIVLTGVDLTAYGRDLAGTVSLGGLVRRLLRELPGLPRLRLSSIDAVEADADLLAAFAEEERLMPHLHLSLQAGDDLVLKRMKRRHLSADAIRFCADLQRRRPGMVFGADLIVGFPTESEEAFARTVEHTDATGLTFIHVFPYSSRPGTPAARMPQLPGAVVKERALRLRAKAAERLAGYLDSQAGRLTDVLFEGPDIGRTPQFARVVASGRAGERRTVRVASHDGARLLAEGAVA
jgi:threonylcarbamoyladenosine tRNA methylthiotransferase MtaB